MPAWIQVILASSAVTIAIGVLWTKALRPGARIVSSFDKMLPVAIQLTEQFHDAPQAFQTLKDIAFQFHTDSGTTLRDVVNRLEQAAKDNAANTEVLKIQYEAAKELAALDRTAMVRLTAVVDQLNAKVDLDAQGRVVIASNLEAAHLRAEAVPATDAGEAADAAAIRPPEEQQ